ncbi:MAG TPA: AsmA family protein [Blastocatellia bacterium]|nr:AsmA family protein [Blastocatellia bacterium]
MRRGFAGKLLLMIAVIIAVIVIIPFVPLAPLKSPVEQKLAATLGRKVSIGSARINLVPKPHLIISGLTVEEDPQFGGDVFLKAEKVQTGLNVIQYVSHRRIIIDSIELQTPEIHLVKNSRGAWNWTTLGKQTSQQSASLTLPSETISYGAAIWIPSGSQIQESMIREIKVIDATVRVKDYTEEGTPEAVYKNVVLEAWLTPQSSADSKVNTQAKGAITFSSQGNDQCDRLVARLPFDLKINASGSVPLSVSGSVGPGPIETQNITIGALAIEGEISSSTDAPITGQGRMSIDNLDIRTINLSERVARALKVDEIGDMNPGTALANLETNFQISQGTVRTTGLKIQRLDGLGDASAQEGSFKVDSSLIVHYPATVVLSPEATSRVKSLNPALGLVVTILETNNRVSVPIDISGDVRNPAVQVDVSRMF